MRYNNHSSSFEKFGKFLALLVVLFFVTIIGFGFRSCVSNATGETKSRAEQQGVIWMNEMYPGENQRIVCQNSDTDGNGYVSCTVRVGQRPPVAIECAVPYSLNSGCKLVIPTYRTQQPQE